MANNRKVWAININKIASDRGLILKVERPFRDPEQVRIGGRGATFSVQRLEDKPAVYVVSHDESGHEWTVAEGADGKLEIVSGQTSGLPQGQGLSVHSVIAAAKKKH